MQGNRIPAAIATALVAFSILLTVLAVAIGEPPLLNGDVHWNGRHIGEWENGRWEGIPEWYIAEAEQSCAAMSNRFFHTASGTYQYFADLDGDGKTEDLVFSCWYSPRVYGVVGILMLCPPLLAGVLLYSRRKGMW